MSGVSITRYDDNNRVTEMMEHDDNGHRASIVHPGINYELANRDDGHSCIIHEYDTHGNAMKTRPPGIDGKFIDLLATAFAVTV